MSERYDLIVLGSGTAARLAAIKVRSANRTVAVIDQRPFGGTCALRGCDPKKMLIAVTSTVDQVIRLRGRGIEAEPRVHWGDLMKFKREFTDPIPEKQEHRLAEHGIAVVHGQARFGGPNAIMVGDRELIGGQILIAVGAEPERLDIPGADHMIDSEDFLALSALPRRVLLVGGGYIAAEFSHIAARAGAEVTVVQDDERMLTGFEPELVDWLMASFRSAGIDVRTATEVTAIEPFGDAFRVIAMSGNESVVFDADVVVHCAGRVPALARLNLEAGEVSTRSGRLQLSEYLQSVSNPAVFAAGDAAQAGPALTPVSSHDARVVSENMVLGPRRKPDYRAIPSVAFTVPPIARVGLSEQAARDQGLPIRVKCRRASDWFTARQAAQPIYGFKVLVDEKSDRIVGAHVVGPAADDTINVFALAMRHDLRASDMSSTLFAYPTAASDISEML